ncbi:hypothetical protein PFISCL1PPCAC_14976, partial [Pristionchus fissidentatus]
MSILRRGQKSISLLLGLSCLLLLVILESSLDGVLGQHGAVELDGREGELPRDILVLNLLSPLDSLSVDPFSGERGRGDSRSTSEGLELGINDLSIVVHLNLELHDISAGGSSDNSSSDVRIILVQRTNVTRILVMIYYLLVIVGSGKERGRSRRNQLSRVLSSQSNRKHFE